MCIRDRGEDRIGHRERFVGAQAEFAARIGDVLRAIAQCERVRTGQHLLGIGRQVDSGELPRGIWRQSDPRRHEAIPAFDSPRNGICVEARLQPVAAGDGNSAVGGDILPAIGQRSQKIRRTDGVPHEGAGLEQVGTASAAARNAEVRSAAGECKARDGIGRETVVGADRGAENAAGGAVGATHRITVGGLRSAVTGSPYAPTLRQGIGHDRRFTVNRGIGVPLGDGALALGCVGTGVAHISKLRSAGRRRRSSTVTAAHVGHRAQKLCHRIEGGLLRAGRSLAGSLCQSRGRQRAVHHGNAARGVEEMRERVADPLLVPIEAGGNREIQSEVEIGVAGIATESSLHVGWQMARDQRSEHAADAAGCGEDRVAFSDIAAAREIRIHRGTAQCRNAGDIGDGCPRRVDLDQVSRAGLEGQIACHVDRRSRRAVARREGAAAVHRYTAHRSGAGERSAAGDRGGRRGDRTAHEQSAFRHRRTAGVGVCTRKHQRAGADLDQRTTCRGRCALRARAAITDDARNRRR